MATPLAVPSRTREQAQAGLSMSEARAANAGLSYSEVTSPASRLSALAGGADNSNAIVSSSDQITTDENQTKKKVSSLNSSVNPTLPGSGSNAAVNASDKYVAALDAQIAALEQRRQADLTGIGAQFDQTKNDLQGAQKSETGTETATLARIGGYLGPSASGTGALLNLAATHKNEVLKLEVARAAAIQAANNAIDDKQFDLAKSKAQEAKDIESEVYKRKQDFFDNSIKLQTQEETNTQNMLKDLASIDPSKISDDAKAKIDAHYGIPGFSDEYFAATAAAAKAKTAKEQADARTSLLDMLQKIPAGQKVAFPDGTEYVGMGSAGDVATFMQTDNNGVGHLITYNKRTGATGAISVGAVGKTSGGSGSGAGGVNGVSPTVVDNTTAVLQSTLEANKDKNGKYDPEAYLALRSELKNGTDYGPKLLRYYDNLFLDKQNGFFDTAGISYLRQKGVFYDAASSAPAPTVVNNYGDGSASDNAP